MVSAPIDQRDQQDTDFVNQSRIYKRTAYVRAAFDNQLLYLEFALELEVHSRQIEIDAARCAGGHRQSFGMRATSPFSNQARHAGQLHLGAEDQAHLGVAAVARAFPAPEVEPAFSGIGEGKRVVHGPKLP